MWSEVLKFSAWILTQAWRIGLSNARKVAAWARANWRQVGKWLQGVGTYNSVLLLIRKIIGV